MGYILSPQARQDLSNIDAYITQDDPAAAERVIATLKVAMDHLATFPHTGRPRDDLTPRRYHFWPVTVCSYFVVYKPETKPLEILRVIRMDRDIGAQLERAAA